ncbi:MAG: hypothetical protein QOG06_760, partial [Gaiellaceae bacterium]|nr:hypothetical protein [Gaiellaceae bacterium]
MKRIKGLLCAFVALACLPAAGVAHAGLDVGVTEDAGKTGNGAAFFATLKDVGLKVNRVSINWDPAAPMTIPGQAEIAKWLPQAQASGIRIIFAVAPHDAHDLTGTPGATAKFVAFVQKLAQTFPSVKDYVIGNEPNQPRFWLPQFSPTGRALAAAQYLPILAGSYDVLKARNPTINVIGVGLSPRGNDQPFAKSNISRSPVRFLHDLGVAYRATGRTRPLMDELAFHPYPARNVDTPEVGYGWPNAGLPNLDRIKQGVWDAFHGTAQPTFAETGGTFAQPLRLDLDEVGWQVGVLPALAALYTGVENGPTTDEATQAQIYGDLIKQAACDPTVRLLNFFHLTDELDLKTWQSGLIRADGSHRPSYDAVKAMIALTHGNCQAASTPWVHASGVVSPFASWGKLSKPLKSNRARWSFLVRAGEEATFRAGIFKAGPPKAVLGRRLATGRPKPVLSATGTIKAKGRVVYFPIRKLKPGKYVYAIRMVSTMNPQRITLLTSTT